MADISFRSKAGFLGPKTPGEVRNLVYRHLLTTKLTFRGYEQSDDAQSRPYYSIDTAILRVNKQVYHEAKPILYDENMWIAFNINIPNWPYRYKEDYFQLPVVAKTLPANIRPTLTVDVEISRLESQSLNILNDGIIEDQQLAPSTLLMGIESLDDLILRLCHLGCRHPEVPFSSRPSMSITLSRDVRFSISRLHEQLLQRFAAVRGFGRINLSTKYDFGQATSLDLLKQMKTPWKRNDNLLDHVLPYIKKGDTACACDLTRTALQHYRNAISLVEYAKDQWKKQILTDNEEYDYGDIFDIRGLIVSRSMRTLLKLRWYTYIIYRYSIYPGDRYLSHRERTRLLLHTGLAFLALDDKGIACNYFVKAMEMEAEGGLTCVVAELEDVLGYCNEGYEGPKCWAIIFNRGFSIPAIDISDPYKIRLGRAMNTYERLYRETWNLGRG